MNELFVIEFEVRVSFYVYLFAKIRFWSIMICLLVGDLFITCYLDNKCVVIVFKFKIAVKIKLFGDRLKDKECIYSNDPLMFYLSSCSKRVYSKQTNLI